MKRVYIYILFTLLIALIVGIIVGVVHSTTKEDIINRNVSPPENISKAQPLSFDAKSSPESLMATNDASVVLCPFNKEWQNVTENECKSRGCIWNPQTSEAKSGISMNPHCFFPRFYRHGYVIEDEEESHTGEVILRLKLIESSLKLFGGIKTRLNVHFIPYGDDIFRIKITVPNEDRYEVPIRMNVPKISRNLTSKYNISFRVDDEYGIKNVFVIQVWRKKTGLMLFDTTIGGFTYSDQFLQISTLLPSENLYGLGENSHYTFKHDMNYKIWPIFSRGVGPKDGEHNLYGTHPVYYVLENDGNSHAVFWLNTNAMEVTTLPTPGLTLRAIGGIIDLFFFMGPNPSQVVSQFTSIIGRPLLPPYWALGFQLCRYGHPNFEDMKAAILRLRRNGIPQDIQYGDIDYMEKRQDFTLDMENFSEFPSYMLEEKKKGLRLIIILDPAINVEADSHYETNVRALREKVYIKWYNETFVPKENYGMGDIMLGYVWPDNRTAFPDWLKSRTQKWWKYEIVRFYDTLKFDGLWIDMNEPVNFGTDQKAPWNWPKDLPYSRYQCPSSRWDDPPYSTKASRIDRYTRLSDRTICMVGVQGENDEYLHYDVHNLYGWSQTVSTMQGVQLATKKRGIVISRSTYTSSGKWGGHWLGSNTARWEDLKGSIIGLLEFNLFGIPYVGADICGHYGNTTEELCRKWMQLGAFYPLSRNHNSRRSKNQDPGIWPSVASASRHALQLRYSLLPYLYTQHFLASTQGETVIRPLFFEFPKDENTWKIDDQFLWGSTLMLSPILKEKATSRETYFPKGIWYAHPKGFLHTFEEGQNINITVMDPNEIILHIRGGKIIPTQRPASNTQMSRTNPLGLIVAPDNSNEAEGILFWDDGESIDTVKSNNYFMAYMFYKNNSITWTVTKDQEELVKDLKLSDVRIYNISSKPNAILVNGKRITKADFIYNPFQKVLQIYDLELNVSNSYTITWTDEYSYKLPCPIPYKNGYNDKINVTKQLCLPACIWNPNENEVPCHLPLNSNFGYIIDGPKKKTRHGFEITLRNTDSRSLFGDDVLKLKFQVFVYSNTILRFKITDAINERYEVPMPLFIPAENASSPLIDIVLESENVGDLFAFYVMRKNTGSILFDTRIGGLVYSNQFLSISSFLPSKNLYGLGENNHVSFKHSFDGKIWPIFNRDQPPTSNENIEVNSYGSHPFYEVSENDGNSHGVFFLNSNAIDYQILDYPAITFRAIGGILDFFIFAGPTPEDVIKQYTKVIHRPSLPPYWSLGFQICRYGYKNTDHIREVLNRTKYYEIPQDIQYADIDYMAERKDFTIDPQNFGDLPILFDEIRSKGMKTIIILDPAINAEMKANEYETHSRALLEDVYIKWPKSVPTELKQYNNPHNNDVLGYVWPDNRTAFPNWHKESTKGWWKKEIHLFYNNSLKFDGLWIDMNEPAVFDTNMDQPWNWPKGRSPWNLKCPQNKWDDPPYATKAAVLGPSFRMSDKTLCLISEEAPFKHYDSHNLYGWSQSEPTLRALQSINNKRGIVISRSTFPGNGQWAGHWLGDNAATWEDLRRSIIGMLEFNLFGIPYIGADICGFFGNSTEELCTRWMQLGAFYPFARNHNGIGYIDQDPGMWPTVANVSKMILNIRYSLLPYLYTLFYEASAYGGTVVRPLHHEFIMDRSTYTIDDQFLWGPALMVSPVLTKGSLERHVYFPMDFWYDFYTGKPVEWPGESIPVDADLDMIPLHIRGGFVLPRQEPAATTEYSRRNPLNLLVALNGSRQAVGSLFWDDGDGIDTVRQNQYDLFNFNFFENSFHISVIKTAGFSSILKLNQITFYGIENEPRDVIMNREHHLEFFYNSTNLVLNLHFNLTLEKDLTLSFLGLWHE